MCDSWRPGINNQNEIWIGDEDPINMKRAEQMQEWMKDTVSEYCDEPEGMDMMRRHILHAAKELHSWHLEKQKDLGKFIANLELTS
tara:strand:- start:790 stop:1047 length:258 start_codon:yes stop_codon:yes gene_type:complete